MTPETSPYWRPTKDGDPRAWNIVKNHYSIRASDKRRSGRFVGPGQRIVLLGEDEKAVFVWRKFLHNHMEHGVNCALFRNESDRLSSELIREAELWAWERWPGERLYTYVNPIMVRSGIPGYCFIRAGWKHSKTIIGGLLLFDKYPNGVQRPAPSRVCRGCRAFKPAYDLRARNGVQCELEYPIKYAGKDEWGQPIFVPGVTNCPRPRRLFGHANILRERLERGLLDTTRTNAE